MKKFLFFLSLLTSVLFFSCEKKDSELDLSSSMKIYGTDIPISYGVIWESNKNILLQKVEYIWQDKYLDDLGVEITDNVVGYFRSNEKVETGNFVLALYGDGMSFIPHLALTKGEGAVVCLHLASPDITQLMPGKYKFADTKFANTFIGYISSSYDMAGKSGNIASITDGEVNISKDGDNYIVTVNIKLANDQMVSCNYNGKLEKCLVSQPLMAKILGVSIHGLLPEITTRTTYNQMFFPGTPDLIATSLDEINKAFLSVSAGTTQNSIGNKSVVEIALALDEVNEEFTFISPIKARAILGHLAENNFPCHTIFMKAPSSFTDSDYDDIEKTGMNFEVTEEVVKFSMKDFKPGYIFFDAGNGTSGVIKVKGIRAPFEMTTDMLAGLGWIIAHNMTSHQLICDIKATTNYGNPKIR